jgi:methyl-accepting chemotaxis protein
VVARVIRLSGIMRGLAKRDYAFELPCAAVPDEIGDLARAMYECRDGLQAADTMATEQARGHQATAARAQQMTALLHAFEAKAQHSLGQFADAAAQLQTTAGGLTGTADHTMDQAGAVAATASETSANVQTVAAAAEELSASIAEINRQVGQSSKVAAQAVEDARHTDQVVQKLAEGAQKIAAVVRLLPDIAGRANLLALNATIEAERAGEARTGFAAVASVVKTLATRTARATEGIAGQITAIQGATRDAVTATGTEGVNCIIGEVSTAAGERGAVGGDVQSGSHEASRHREMLRGHIASFLAAARAA